MSTVNSEIKITIVDICCICLEECSEYINCCNGIIHDNCLNTIFKNNGDYINKKLLINCPYCRSSVITDKNIIIEEYLLAQRIIDKIIITNDNMILRRSYLCLVLFALMIICMLIYNLTGTR